MRMRTTEHRSGFKGNAQRPKKDTSGEDFQKFLLRVNHVRVNHVRVNHKLATNSEKFRKENIFQREQVK